MPISEVTTVNDGIMNLEIGTWADTEKNNNEVYIMEKFDYWYWNKVFTPEEVTQINTTIEQNYHEDEPSNLGAHRNGKPLKTSRVKLVYYKHLQSFFDNFTDYWQDTLNHKFGIDFYPLRSVDVLHHNTYSAETKSSYDWHDDTTESPNVDMKMTMLINLSENSFTGGEFELDKGGRQYQVTELKEAGNVIMFKSHINHRVLPVLTGERKTLSAFIYGPRWR